MLSFLHYELYYLVVTIKKKLIKLITIELR